MVGDGSAAGVAFDALPFVGSGVDQFDGARHVGTFDGHRDQRPPALMDSSRATRFGSAIGSDKELSAACRICNSLQPLMFHSSATVDTSSLTANSPRS